MRLRNLRLCKVQTAQLRIVRSMNEYLIVWKSFDRSHMNRFEVLHCHSHNLNLENWILDNLFVLMHLDILSCFHSMFHSFDIFWAWSPSRKSPRRNWVERCLEMLFHHRWWCHFAEHVVFRNQQLKAKKKNNEFSSKRNGKARKFSIRMKLYKIVRKVD